MKFTESTELVSAFIDLITGLVLLPLSFLLFKKESNDKKLKSFWLIVIGGLSIGNIIGFFLHAFEISEIANDLIWIVLFFIMFALSLSFFMLSMHNASLGERLTRKEGIIIYIITGIVYLASVIISFLTVNEIRAFVIYAAVIDLPAIVILVILTFKFKRKMGYYILIAGIPQAFGLVFQLTKSGKFELFGLTFNHNSIYHLCLLFSCVFFFFAAMVDLEEEKIEKLF